MVAMSNQIIAIHGENEPRASVVEEVRAHMGRRRISASALGRMTGTTRGGSWPSFVGRRRS